MNESQKKVTEEYRQNWDEIFKKKEETENPDLAWARSVNKWEADYQASRKKRLGWTDNWTGD
jgi:P2-related tail formation protein